MVATNNQVQRRQPCIQCSLSFFISSALYKVHPTFFKFCAIPEVLSPPCLQPYFFVLSRNDLMMSIAPITMYDADAQVAWEMFRFAPKQLTWMKACCLHPSSWTATR